MKYILQVWTVGEAGADMVEVDLRCPNRLEEAHRKALRHAEAYVRAFGLRNVEFLFWGEREDGSRTRFPL